MQIVDKNCRKEGILKGGAKSVGFSGSECEGSKCVQVRDAPKRVDALRANNIKERRDKEGTSEGHIDRVVI